MRGLLAILLLGGTMAARPAAAGGADPVREAGRQAWLTATAAAADVQLSRLQAQLEAAVDAGRTGAALIVSGEDPPGPSLLEAAELLEAARSSVEAAGGAIGRLQGTLSAVRPDAAIVDQGLLPGGLDGIATQLRASADAAEPFVSRRWAAEATLASLADALAALDDDDPQVALAALGDADVALRQVADWEEPPRSLGFWLATTAELLAAARAIADAAIAEDPAAAAAAAEAYRAAAEKARDADRALALALAEAGAAIAEVPMRRLAQALARLIELQAIVSSIAAGGQ